MRQALLIFIFGFASCFYAYEDVEASSVQSNASITFYGVEDSPLEQNDNVDDENIGDNGSNKEGNSEDVNNNNGSGDIKNDQTNNHGLFPQTGDVFEMKLIVFSLILSSIVLLGMLRAKRKQKGQESY